MNNITNKVFGRLTAIEKTDKRGNGISVVWICHCECGNIVHVAYRYLANGHISSCGCLSKETYTRHMENGREINKKNIVDGTNIRIISQKKMQKNNTSGVTGVYWDKRANKWLAIIEFKGKCYRLGSFDAKDDAIKARKKAEEKYHDSFLEWYYSQKNKEERNI